MGEPEDAVAMAGDQALPKALGDSGLQSQTLESVADADNYHDWLTSLALPYLGDDPIELGSGLGDYAVRWLELGVPRVTATEVDPSRLAGLKERFRDDKRVTVTGIDVLNPTPGDYSSFVAFNVLEHIPDHVGALRAAHTLLRPGGAVIMFVPAFQFAMSKFDRQVGHVRRYTVGSLSGAMRDAGLQVETAHYVNIPGLFAWFVGMRLLRMTPGNGGILDFWDDKVIPRTRAIEEKRKAPFGQSVFAVARVPASR
jgi:SAM-dependent methyltransferase